MFYIFYNECSFHVSDELDLTTSWIHGTPSYSLEWVQIQDTKRLQHKSTNCTPISAWYLQLANDTNVYRQKLCELRPFWEQRLCQCKYHKTKSRMIHLVCTASQKFNYLCASIRMPYTTTQSQSYILSFRVTCTKKKNWVFLWRVYASC